MKVALCLSGLTRSINLGWNSINKYLKTPYNADVFIHTWDIDHGGNRFSCSDKTGLPLLPSFPKDITKVQFLEEEIKPKKYIIENYEKWTKNNTESIAHSMWYSIFTANNLKTHHEQESNFTYDLVIRCRMDLLFEAYLDRDDIKKTLETKNLIYVALPGNKKDPRFVTDAFAFGSSQALNSYSEVWNDIKGKRITPSAPEFLLQNKLNESGISFEWSLNTRYRIVHKWNSQYIQFWGDF
jgi:hypothetical protein